MTGPVFDDDEPIHDSPRAVQQHSREVSVKRRQRRVWTGLLRPASPQGCGDDWVEADLPMPYRGVTVGLPGRMLRSPVPAQDFHDANLRQATTGTSIDVRPQDAFLTSQVPPRAVWLSRLRDWGSCSARPRGGGDLPRRNGVRRQCRVLVCDHPRNARIFAPMWDDCPRIFSQTF